jgi:hypothetical protein
VPKVVVKQVLAAAETKIEPAPKETKPIVTRSDPKPPPPEQVKTQESAQEQPETQSSEPKKGRFWGKLNPFHSLKKKKENSALRSPGGTPPAAHQN